MKILSRGSPDRILWAPVSERLVVPPLEPPWELLEDLSEPS